MPFTSERKNFIRNLELMIVDAFDDSDDEAVEELVELHDFFLGFFKIPKMRHFDTSHFVVFC